MGRADEDLPPQDWTVAGWSEAVPSRTPGTSSTSLEQARCEDFQACVTWPRGGFHGIPGIQKFRSSEFRVDITTNFGHRARPRLVASDETADIELEEFKGSKDEMQSTLMSVPASAPWINNLDHHRHIWTHFKNQCLWHGGIRPGMHQKQMM